MSGRHWAVAGVAVVVVAVGTGAAAATGAFGQSRAPAMASSQYGTSTQPVTQRSLTEQTQVTGTLGNADSYTVVSQATGTITALPGIGQVISQGEVAYQVSGQPVVLLYGAVPDYRALSEGMTGADVTELNRALVALGYANSADVSALGWDYFSWETAYALEQLQTHLGTTVTGGLPLGQAVFLPTTIQVTGYAQATVLDGSATAGQELLTATSTTPVVTIDLDPSLQTEVKRGDKVSVSLPNGTTTPGVISSVGSVATSPASSGSSGSSGSTGSSSGSTGSSNSSGSSSGSGSGSATIPVQVSLNDPKAAGGLTQAPVTVTISTASVSDALVVPVDALLAQTNGGYAVEVTNPGGHHLVSVSTGLFDDADGLVQVSGSGVSAGQQVVVPTT